MRDWEQEYRDFIARGAALLEKQVDAIGDAMLEPVYQLALNTLLNAKIDEIRAMWYGGGAFGGYWYCRECGNPQLGEPPFKGLGVLERCRPCGPGEGWVPCPAMPHRPGGCGLCKLEGWVGELDPAA